MNKDFLKKIKENGYYRFYVVYFWENENSLGEDVFLPCVEDSIPECAVYQKTEKTENTTTEIWKGISGKIYHVEYAEISEEEMEDLRKEEEE